VSPRLGAICGLLSPLTFTVGWVLGGLAQPAAYDSVEHTISDLGAQTADRAWLYNQVSANLSGLLVLALAVALWPVLGSRRPGRIGVLALGVFGVGEFLDGFFRLDCREIDAGCTANGYSALATAHLVESVFTILAMPVAALVLARAFRSEAAWRDLRVPSLVAGALTLVGLLGLSVWGVGLGERVGISVWFVWVALVSWRLLRLPSTDVGQSR
jgi:hypothetical membrane protein